MAYVSAQVGSYKCAKGHLGGVYGLGPNSVRRHVFEIPYTINRYESGFFENRVSGFDC